MSRYARQEILPEVGAAGQDRLRAAKVLVIGAGGLASSVLPLLAAAGIGRLTIVDGDRVDRSNLHRQTLFAEADQDRPKAEVAAERCRALNSDATVLPLPHALTPDNAASLVEIADVVLDCADSYAVSYTLSDICRGLGKPLISASVLGLSGYVGGFCGSAPSLRAVFPDAPDSGASCATAGVMGPVVAMLGAAQAQMALAVILRLQPDPLGQLLRFDMGTYRTSAFRFDGAAEPGGFFPFIGRETLSERDRIIELRAPDEAPEPIHARAERIAPDSLQDRLDGKNQRLVLCCATGLRAWRAAEDIHDTWPGEIVLIAATAS